MIEVRQLGYETGETKHATASGTTSYRLFRDDGSEVLSGSVTPVYQSLSGEEAAVIDFSGVTTPGRYYFTDDNGTRSPSFTIGDDPYASALRDVLRMFYFQRCGMELEERYAGRYAHKACHCSEASFLFEPDRKPVRITGGWHDAGDYGRYVTPGAVTLGHLLYSFLLNPVPYDRSLDIPESGNGMPDLLNECRYELNWMLQMQDSDGGVHHKVTSRSFVGYVMPEDDRLPMVITPVSSLATADFAAVTALAARIYKAYDSDFSKTLREAALRAADWLEANGRMIFDNPKECTTGAYADAIDADERLWAAAELYQLTGDEKYLNRIRMILELHVSTVALGWADVGGFASFSVLLAETGRFPEDLCDRLRVGLTDEADRLCAAAGNAYEVAVHAHDFKWGSNMVVMTNAMVLIMAHHLTKKEAYLRTARYQLDYLFGRNALRQSYVTGYGERAFRNPHNRPTIADGIEEPIPGFVSGGPNYRACDSIANAETLKGEAPMKCYRDHTDSYSTNEIAIYWNSPLAFVLAYLENLRR
ncbi:MAG: glycoside hydrolase family 9 protein [Lachnospiraceae bacterium]|nr:glycoside hydrolase family 9 protein [Lachnospiraceae bacterium]